MAAALGIPGAALPPGIFKINAEVITALETAEELHSLEIRHLWAKCAVWQHNFQDPDSRRAENFWWHVWGSNRKKLPPRTLAKLLNDIREAPTVVPLLSKPSLPQGVEDESKDVVTRPATTGDELISPLLSPKISSLGSFTSPPSSCSSLSSAIVAGHGLRTPDHKGKRPARARNRPSPSAERRPSPRRSILKTMEDARASGARCRTPLPCSFSPIHLPENAIFEDDEDDDDDEDLSPLEPPPSLIAQPPDFVLNQPSWCARREAARGERQILRASNPLEAGTRFRPASRRHAAPSDPGPATGKAITDPRHLSSAGSTGPRVRVVGFGPFPKVPGHPSSVSPTHHGISPVAQHDPSRRQRFNPQMSSTKEEPRFFSPLGTNWEELPGLEPSPVTARSGTVDEPEDVTAKWPRTTCANNTESQGSNTSNTIALPADLARPPIPETYKRPKAVTLDTPVFGCRPFYLSSTLESRRATTIARREVERQLPPLPRAGEPRHSAERCHRGSAGVASHDGVGMTRGAGGGAGGARGQALEAWRRGAAAAAAAAAAAHKPFFIDDVLRGGDDSQPKKRRAAAAETNTNTNTETTGTGSQHRDEKLPSSPVGEGREAPHGSGGGGGGEGATPTLHALNDHPSSSSKVLPEGSKESLRGPGSSPSLLSFLLNRESDRARRG